VSPGVVQETVGPVRARVSETMIGRADHPSPQGRGRLRTGRGPATMAVVEPTALDLPHRAAPARGLEARRRRGGRIAHLEALLRQTA
jgi:hypothetical protein